MCVVWYNKQEDEEQVVGLVEENYGCMMRFLCKKIGSVMDREGKETRP